MDILSPPHPKAEPSGTALIFLHSVIANGRVFPHGFPDFGFGIVGAGVVHYKDIARSALPSQRLQTLEQHILSVIGNHHCCNLIHVFP